MPKAAPAAVVVLAAGAGTRLKSSKPKVLHRLGGRSMLSLVLRAATGLEPDRIAVVVRAQRDEVAEHALAQFPDVTIVDQDEIPGTGRAVQCALGALDAAAQARQLIEHDKANEGAGGFPATLGDGVTGAILVVAGDVPLMDTETLERLYAAHIAGGNAITLLTAQVDNPYGYGRVVREAQTGAVLRIVEHRDASEDERAIHEINTSTYVFDAVVLRRMLSGLTAHNDQREIYLTDVVAAAAHEGLRVEAQVVDDPLTTEGVNDRVQLAQATRELNRRTLVRWMHEGVTIVDPASTWVDVDAELAADVTLLPGTQILGASVVASGASIGPDTTLTDVEVGPGAEVVRTHAQLAVIGARATVGPFTYLRPGAVLHDGAKAGAFVEIKNSAIGPGSKVPHLSYVGDAEIGSGTNVGAGSIFVNYDGVAKHRSQVGDAVRLGANNIVIAPVTIGDGAYTGGGTTARQDVPPGALAVSAGGQRVIPGWVRVRRAGTPSALAAAAAGAPAGPDASDVSAQAKQERAAGSRQGDAMQELAQRHGLRHGDSADGTPIPHGLGPIPGHDYRVPDAAPAPAPHHEGPAQQ